MISFWVSGKPQPQGSAKAFVVNGRARITSANRNLNQWRDLVASQAQGIVPAPITGPVELRLEFHLPRPATLPKKVLHHIKRPDLDKLVRAACDAITHVLIRDDAQVVILTAVKLYAPPAGRVGCQISINPIAVGNAA